MTMSAAPAKVSNQRPRRLHYGLVVLALIVLAVFSSLGLARFGYTSILPTMQESLKLSNTQAGELQSWNLLGYLVTVAFAGLLAARGRPVRLGVGLVAALSVAGAPASGGGLSCVRLFLHHLLDLFHPAFGQGSRAEPGLRRAGVAGHRHGVGRQRLYLGQCVRPLGPAAGAGVRLCVPRGVVPCLWLQPPVAGGLLLGGSVCPHRLKRAGVDGGALR